MLTAVGLPALPTAQTAQVAQMAETATSTVRNSNGFWNTVKNPQIVPRISSSYKSFISHPATQNVGSAISTAWTKSRELFDFYKTLAVMIPTGVELLRYFQYGSYSPKKSNKNDGIATDNPIQSSISRKPDIGGKRIVIHDPLFKTSSRGSFMEDTI